MWIVIASAYGDGESYFGHRIWSERFYSRAAADEAARFLAKGGRAEVRVLDDRPGSAAITPPHS